MKDQATRDKERRHLNRLETLIDSIYALVIVLIVIYWLQNEALFGFLERTDNRHASIAITQIFFVLIYLYTADLFQAFPDARSVLAIQSVVFAMMGFLAIWGWVYATKDRRLVGEELSEEKIRATVTKVLPEPLTALVTLACAPFGTLAWNLAWLAAPLIAIVVRRRK